jgi:hypothetical protein
MPFIGNKPAQVPLTSADIADSIITSAKIVDGTIVNADINASAGVVLTKLASTGTLTVDNIQFPATAVASANANNLDDYEEGTFTPTIKGGTTAGTGTYSNQTGTYTKIGDLCFINIFIQWSAHTGSGHMKISGLPFTTLDKYQGVVPHTADIPFTGNIEMEVNPSDTELYFYQNNNGSVTTINIDTSAFAMVTWVYKTA